jgi:predicted ribosome quality control (RQC) complex YloA/Tae2 family protein
MLLRKHLHRLARRIGATPGRERIIEITFLTQNELGDKVEKTLVPSSWAATATSSSSIRIGASMTRSST